MPTESSKDPIVIRPRGEKISVKSSCGSVERPWWQHIQCRGLVLLSSFVAYYEWPFFEHSFRNMFCILAESGELASCLSVRLDESLLAVLHGEG